jgi:deoxyribodipyrimidine photo-lyase
MATSFIIENTDSRVQLLNSAPFQAGAKYVLYWAQVNRRVAYNHGLAYAVELANQAGLPVLFYEGLTFDYPYASDRFDKFILEGTPDTERQLERLGIGYVFYHRRKRSDPNDVLYRLAKDAAAVITDDYPLWPARFYNPRVAAKLKIPYYAVDSSCIVPMSCFQKREYAAYTIRPKIRNLLPKYLRSMPAIRVRRKFSGQSSKPVGSIGSGVYAGGSVAAHIRLMQFLKHSLHRYANLSNQPSEKATSGLSPYLHFGHISSLEVALAIQNYAREHKLLPDEFLEELIVRRELAFNFARLGPQDPYETLTRQTRSYLRERPARADPNSRPSVERRAGGTAADGKNPRILPHVLGQKDHRMVANTPRSAGYYPLPERPLRPRRPRSKFVREYPMVLRSA